MAAWRAVVVVGDEGDGGAGFGEGLGGGEAHAGAGAGDEGDVAGEVVGGVLWWTVAWWAPVRR